MPRAGGEPPWPTYHGDDARTGNTSEPGPLTGNLLWSNGTGSYSFSNNVTGNLGLVSDYRFRGYTQTDYNPALQGGVDFAHKSGFYLGNWNSNVEQSLYTGASLEMDFYGGYKHAFEGGFGIDIGASSGVGAPVSDSPATT